MSSITIHEIDEDLDRRLTVEANRRRKSKNTLVKELLAVSLGMPGPARGDDAYLEFLGLWSPEAAAAFDVATADNEAIDPADWR